MAGYNESGTARKQLSNHDARAYCEGMNARIASATPVNPYTGTQQLEELIAWDAGKDYAATFAGGSISRSECKSCAVDTSATVPVA